MRLLPLILLLAAVPARAGVLVVGGPGADFGSIQAALDQAVAGDTILVHETAIPYFEKIVFPRSGSAAGGVITLQAFPGEHPVLDGSGVPGGNMVLIDSRSWVRLIGFEIRNHLGVNDGSGVRILGAGSHIEVRDNRIHDIRGRHAMGITVYGTETDPISDLVIDGNEIHDCEPFPSEALTLNGNVTSFEVTNNVVRDVNNIGIDFIGGETDIQPDPARVARNGVCRGNRISRANQKGGGYAGGIYVDGGRDIVIENNVVTESDLGIEVGAENRGTDARNIVVRNNLIHANQRVCIVFGGYDSSVGRVRDSRFLNNTCYRNDTRGEGVGELWIQYARDNLVRNNLFLATAQNVLLYSEDGNRNNTLDYNLFFAEAGPEAAEFTWKGRSYAGFDAYRVGSGQDGHSLFSDPRLVDPPGGDFHLQAGSPAIDRGDPAFVPAPGEVDLDGAPRVSGGRVDMGADEAGCGDGVLDPGEECDDGNPVDGDGCDSNCTPAGCGNGIPTAGETCDDGNLEDGDCCSSACRPRPAGTPCDDGEPCTTGDACLDGVCAGSSLPRNDCREPALPGGSSILLRDRSPDDRDLLRWTWRKGAAAALSDFGDPAGGSTFYTLCIYDEVAGEPRIVLEATAPPGGLCGGRACWRSAGARGFRYRDAGHAVDGLQQITLRPGPEGRARLQVRGKGPQLRMPALPLAQGSTVHVQLQSSEGVCWSARYAAPAARNGSSRFKDRSD